jgi:ClpP class serine protease
MPYYVDPFSVLINMMWLLLLIFVILQPWLSKWQLQRAREALIREMEYKRKSRVITMIHRQESLGFLGIPLFRVITIEDSEQVLRAIRMTPEDMAIDFIIHTPGGLALAATQIANALKNHKGEVRVIVPHYAMSGGTLIALAADKIIMDPHAVLGPVDPQVGQFPAVSIKKVLEKKPIEKIDDQTLILVDVAEKALKQMYDYVYNLLKEKGYDEETAKKVAEDFSQGKWTHDYPLTYEILKEYNLRVSTEVPEEVYELMELYPQPKNNAVPAVQYIPVPYKKEMKTKGA